AIASVFNSDGDFKKALGDPLYDRIREALYRTDEQNLKLEGEGPKTNASDNEQKTRVVEVIQEHTEETSEETHTIEVVEQGMEEKNQEIHVDQNEGESTSHGMTAQSRTTYCEIEEEGMEDSRREEVRSKKSNSLREVTHNKVAPASPVENLVVPGQINQVTLYSIEKGKAEGPDHVLNDPVIIGEEIKENDTDGGKKSRNRRRKYRLCCFHPSSRQSMI
ncbi:hypothetical protein CRG98_044301, partial [Punica granatum]